MTDDERKAAAQSALAARIAANGGHPDRGDVYRHYKGGDEGYVVLMVGLREDILEPMVGYFNIGHRTYSFLPLAIWLEIVEVGGEMVPRFKLWKSGEARA